MKSEPYSKSEQIKDAVFVVAMIPLAYAFVVLTFLL